MRTHDLGYKRRRRMKVRKRRREYRRERRGEEKGDMAERWQSRRRIGRMKLRLDREKKILLGVCGGIARYLGIEAWQARLAFLLGMILIPAVLAILYLIFWALLRKEDDIDDVDVDRSTNSKRKSRTERETEETLETEELDILHARPRFALRVVQSDFQELELKLRRIEKFVASGQYELHRGFSSIENEIR